MNQVARRPRLYMTTDEFLAWPGDGSARNYELVDGEVRPMPPASRIHGAIQANLTWLIVSVIRAARAPVSAVIEGAIIPALNASRNVRVPDLVVGPSESRRGEQVITDPLLIIEVLSPGNKKETRDNVRAYATLPSVREIAVVHSERMLAEIHHRDATGAWLPDPEAVGPGERVQLPSVGLNCALEDIYADTWLTGTKISDG
jgi:Uma2 family endonuclease